MINSNRISEEFARLAAIASPSFGEGEISRYLCERLTRLGGEVVFDDAAQRIGSESGNLVAYFPAQGRDCAPLMLSLHMDTVEPAHGVVPVLRDGVFFSAGDTVLGADDKAGIAEVIEALEVMRERQIPRGPVEVVITVCEEVGLLGAKHFDFSLLKSRRGLALDTSGVDLAIHRAPAGNKLRVEVIGREAHAGISPERGISAVEATARAIARMQLGRIDPETTANIGTIHGGQAINIVPRRVVVEGEARSHDPQRLEIQTEHMIECFQDAARELQREIDGALVAPEVRWEITSDYPRMHVPLEGPMVALVQAAAAALGRPLEVRAAGGGSDANIFNAQGIETLILGTGMTNVHTVDESVSVADMVRVAEFLVETLRRA
ncbi:M20/M25/M40 family metallo-hydrolase [Geoalkalibacter halelectricus]|uniref:M20/M25/M40 family metallo-hydrolase n=1 Tax=Geoalkalibacter halelectricus TaxID=2847045 RepID=A0ABY5ZTD4_9BACT|nr:M20/M25/M40 family metallo-hydrolase [Geoalkalibacter halelectricus]MDO3376901.1 M20/M25/M40 family metallo-hydrolase [Geoalkalibacter halelectricus]UWZ81125.1 M20/M25/M40 family metallo-hydrolase [Geoalkalibacter halelectricus]